MRLGKLHITKWDYQKDDFIWFEYIKTPCECRILTIFNILFMYYSDFCNNASLSDKEKK